MFSTNKNIETIAQLIEVIKHYIGLQKEYMKLDVIEKIVKLLTVGAMTIILAILLLLFIIHLSFAAAFYIGTFIGNPLAFTVVAAFHLGFLILCIVFRKQCLEKPLVKFLAGILMD